MNLESVTVQDVLLMISKTNHPRREKIVSTVRVMSRDHFECNVCGWQSEAWKRNFVPKKSSGKPLVRTQKALVEHVANHNMGVL